MVVSYACQCTDDMETKETFFESNIIHRYADTSGAGKDVYEFVSQGRGDFHHT